MAAKKQKPKPQPQAQQVKKKPAERSMSLTADPKWYITPAIIFALCFVLYGNSISHDYVLDDDIYTRKNVYVQQGFPHIKDIFNKGSLYGFNGNNESNYRPLVLLNFMLEMQIFGTNPMNPHISHFFNVLFFAICCILLFFVMKQIFKEYNKLIPLAVTLLFMCHPIHTEAVANVKSRDEILGLLFGLISFYCIFRYTDTKKLSHYVISVLAFFCSALCKENSLTFVVIIPLLLYFFTSTDLEKMFKLWIPFAIMAGICILMRMHALSSVTFHDKMEVINNSLEAAKSGADKFATKLMMMGKYIYMLIIPYPLSWDYSYNQIPIVSFANIKVILSILMYLALGAYAIWGAKNKSIYSFAILFYVITIFLSSNLIVEIGASFAERFLFVPSIGFCMALPLLVTSLFKINPKHALWPNKISFYGSIGIVALIFAVILVRRNQDWADSMSLFKSGVISAPNSARTHDSMAREYRSQGEQATDPNQKRQWFALSIEEFHKSISILNTDPDIYYNMGVTFYDNGMQDSALAVYEKAVAVNPNYPMAYNNMGVIYFNKKQFDKAIEFFSKALKSDTNDVQAMVNIGASYQNAGDNAKALGMYNRVLIKDPKNANVANNVSNMYISSGMKYFNDKDYDNALQQFLLALKYDPNSANGYGNIGAVYQSKGENAKAIEYYQKALAIDPKNEVFRRNMAQLNAAQKPIK